MLDSTQLIDSPPAAEFFGDIGSLAAALAAAQSEFLPIEKNCVNPQFNSRYADLATVIAATRPALTKHKLSVIQLPTGDANRIGITTLLLHPSGAGVRSTLYLPMPDGSLTSSGLAQAYARRYSYQAMICVAGEEDTDGRIVVNTTESTSVKPPAPVTAPTVNHAPVKGKNEPRPGEEKKKSKTPTKPGPEPGPPQNTANVHGVDITDADLPEGLGEPKSEPVQKLDSKTKKQIADHIRSYKMPESFPMQKTIMKLTGVEDTNKMSKAQWDTTLAKLDEMAAGEGGIEGWVKQWWPGFLEVA